MTFKCTGAKKKKKNPTTYLGFTLFLPKSFKAFPNLSSESQPKDFYLFAGAYVQIKPYLELTVGLLSISTV